MKKIFLIPFLTLFIHNLTVAQTVILPNDNDSRVITTGVPFMLIAPDARAAGMGDVGVATSVDAFSQQWNPSKYAFSETKSGFGVSYTPYLSKLVDDISVGYLTYFNRLSESSAVSGSLKYFTLGEIELRLTEDDLGIPVKPNEFTVDVAYSLRLADQFAMSVGLRFLQSNLRISAVDVNAKPASTFGVDISGYYQSEEEAYDSFNGRWRAGFSLQNLGPKFKYDDGGQDNFQPSNLRLGAGFDFIFDEYNKLGVTAEFAKLLVPTPPVLATEYNFEDKNGNGVFDPENGTDADDTDVLDTQNPVRRNFILEGKDNNVGFMSGIFQSFGDAPGGFSEELREFTWALGAEYSYQDSFDFRLGYFNEAEDKGARKFFSLGAGFQYNVIGIDLSYLFSASKVQSPLENTLRFSLTFNLGEDEYDEY